jgi:hypothetical protein
MPIEHTYSFKWSDELTTKKNGAFKRGVRINLKAQTFFQRQHHLVDIKTISSVLSPASQGYQSFEFSTMASESTIPILVEFT